jgi:hypothetical protein
MLAAKAGMVLRILLRGVIGGEHGRGQFQRRDISFCSVIKLGRGTCIHGVVVRDSARNVLGDV